MVRLSRVASGSRFGSTVRPSGIGDHDVQAGSGLDDFDVGGVRPRQRQFC
jgi:hypothetical protein